MRDSNNDQDEILHITHSFELDVIATHTHKALHIAIAMLARRSSQRALSSRWRLASHDHTTAIIHWPRLQCSTFRFEGNAKIFGTVSANDKNTSAANRYPPRKVLCFQLTESD